ncbi:MAG: polysaccharide deacetylase [Peptococcaceae bacterium]|nr:polysaccharide deacetylase [Peptococcaceae bacterium]
MEQQQPKERYFGSVRFFKNMILLAVIIMIAVPTCLSVYLVKDLQKTEQHLQEMTAQYDEMCQSEMIWYGWEAESPYANLYPDFYAPQSLSEGVRENGVIYLTFDDGPSARTGEILDVLKEKNVKATFFVIGSQGEANAQLLKRIVDEGHTIAMHTSSHNYTKIYASVEDYLADMYQIFTQIRETTGVTPTLFRFPGGSINNYNSGISHELIAEMLRRGFVPFDWNISSRDAATVKLLPAETLVNNVVNDAKKMPYGIVLMHDSAAKTTTAKAVGPMIDQLREMGFELKALTPETKSMLFAYGK